MRFSKEAVSSGVAMVLPMRVEVRAAALRRGAMIEIQGLWFLLG